MTAPLRVRALLLAACIAAICTTTTRAQTVATDPLTCWWRASSGGVRVGESFSVVLTCSVVETDAVKVVPDESILDPTVMQLPPFDVVSGAHPPDLRADDRRFFQYEYQLRLVAEDQFGKDVKLPEVKLTFRVHTTVNGAAAVEGREQAYILPPLSFRVVSLVPSDADDIRDADAETLADVDARAFRANLFRTVASVLGALAALTLGLALARLVGRRRRARPAAERVIGDLTVLRRVRGELAEVARERQQTGWTAPLANRLAAALRIVGGYALSRSANRAAVPVETPGATRYDGCLIVRAGLTGRRKAAVSSSTTPSSLAQERARLAGRDPSDVGRANLLEEIERALASTTTAQYGRVEPLDDSTLDEAVEIGTRAVRRVRTDQLLRKVTRMWSR